jgi:hypothetical protein
VSAYHELATVIIGYHFYVMMNLVDVFFHPAGRGIHPVREVPFPDRAGSFVAGLVRYGLCRPSPSANDQYPIALTEPLFSAKEMRKEKLSEFLYYSKSKMLQEIYAQNCRR